MTKKQEPWFQKRIKQLESQLEKANHFGSDYKSASTVLQSKLEAKTTELKEVQFKLHQANKYLLQLEDPITLLNPFLSRLQEELQKEFDQTTTDKDTKKLADQLVNIYELISVAAELSLIVSEYKNPSKTESNPVEELLLTGSLVHLKDEIVKKHELDDNFGLLQGLTGAGTIYVVLVTRKGKSIQIGINKDVLEECNTLLDWSAPRWSTPNKKFGLHKFGLVLKEKSRKVLK